MYRELNEDEIEYKCSDIPQTKKLTVRIVAAIMAVFAIFIAMTIPGMFKKVDSLTLISTILALTVFAAIEVGLFIFCRWRLKQLTLEGDPAYYEAADVRVIEKREIDVTIHRELDRAFELTISLFGDSSVCVTKRVCYSDGEKIAVGTTASLIKPKSFNNIKYFDLMFH